MAGRRPKPTHLRLASRNAAKRPLNTREPKPKIAVPGVPRHVSAPAKAAWRRFAPLLESTGVLTEADGAALEQLCETYAEVVALRADLAKKGRFQTVLTKSGDGMERLRPAYSALMDADRRLRAWMVEFGKTPSARSKVHVDASAADDDPAAEYFS